ncbi:MAG: hypothetical protein P8126_04745 [Gammaproteobacteria bacterium]
MKTLKQTGFTLVEIVVIGLLLGGILKGQQLINSARVRNLADQNSGVQAAYYGFIDRFRNLPGDMKPADACSAIGSAIDTVNKCATPSSAPGGDGNGRIDTVDEAAAVWAHLSAANFLNGTYSGVLSTPGSATEYRVSAVADGIVPPNAFQGPIMIAHTQDYIEGNSAASIVRLAYSFGGKIPVPLLRDLDQKLDDGIAGTGVMRASAEKAAADSHTFGPIVEWTSTGSATEDCYDSSSNAKWNVDSANQTCNAIFLY